MKNIYIDFTQSISGRGARYHGGGNYTKRLLGLISETGNWNKNVIVLWPKGYDPSSKEEKSIRTCDKFIIQEVEKADESVNYEQESAVFFPLINARSWKVVKKIKNRHPEIKIYTTIHGLRLLDLKPDKYDHFYHNNRFNNMFYSHIEYLIKSTIYKRWLKEYLPYFDKIFTVSNFSMQQILSIGNANYINFYYQGIILGSNSKEFSIEDDYILFVGANRAEKNFIRALEAFCSYKNKNSNKMFLYVTGIDEVMKNKILEHYDTDKKILIAEWVKFFDYVETDYLSSLYKKCKFLLYTSKSEGFGLPVMEAIYNNRPVVASYITSIPEVAGPAVYYVNPYDIDSIEKGIAYMSNPSNRHRYENMIQKTVHIMKSRVEMEQEALITEIME